MPVFGWTPDVFWKASLKELYAAIEGHNRVHGIGPDKTSITKSDHDELRKLKATYG